MWLIKPFKELIKACFRIAVIINPQSVLRALGLFSRLADLAQSSSFLFLAGTLCDKCERMVWVPVPSLEFQNSLPPVSWTNLVIHPGRHYKSQTGQTGWCFSDQVSSNMNTMIKDTDAPTYEWWARQAYWHMRFQEPKLQSASLYYHENPIQNGKQMLLHILNKQSLIFFHSSALYPHNMSLYIIRHLITLVALYLTPTQKTHKSCIIITRPRNTIHIYMGACPKVKIEFHACKSPSPMLRIDWCGYNGGCVMHTRSPLGLRIKI